MTTPPLTPCLPRHAFELDPAVLWVMHCAEGPVPRRAAEEVAAMMVKELRPWAMRWKEDFLGLPARVRRAGAAVLGCAADDLTIVPTTSSGLITIAQGLPWERGDEIVVPRGEFPSNVWPWRALATRGVVVREVPLWDGHRAGTEAWESAPPSAATAAGEAPEDRLAAAIGPRTRLLAASWVRFQDGLRLDLERLGAACRARGAALVVDGIQGAGTLVPDLRHVDAFATGGHKGLCAPQGLGLLWTAPSFRARITPPGGWLSVEDATRFERPSTDFARAFLADGTALEHGVPNLVGAAALAAALETLAQAGVAKIAAHVAALQRALLDRLVAAPAWAPDAARLRALLDAGLLGSILALHHGGRGAAGLDAFLRRGFAAGIHASVREGYLRIALHGWHDAADIARLAAWLRDAP